ncbi:hypothetical protein CNEO_260047 [Clostridium neonatale]|nr:hypothetical protein CNEO_260047 [Clostridium neonatale]
MVEKLIKNIISNLCKRLLCSNFTKDNYTGGKEYDKKIKQSNFSFSSCCCCKFISTSNRCYGC